MIRLINKNTILIILLLTIVATAFIYYVRHIYHETYLRRFNEVYSDGIYPSENDEYTIRISIERRDDLDEHYIRGTLTKKEFILEKHILVIDEPYARRNLTKKEFIPENHILISNSNSREIYQKKEYTKFDYGNNSNAIYVAWIDEKTVQIGDKKIDLRYHFSLIRLHMIIDHFIREVKALKRQINPENSNSTDWNENTIHAPYEPEE